MSDLQDTLTKIAGKNALTVQDKEIQKLCKALNYMSTQFQIQMRTVCDDDEYVQDTVKVIRESANYILEKE